MYVTAAVGLASACLSKTVIKQLFWHPLYDKKIGQIEAIYIEAREIHLKNYASAVVQVRIHGVYRVRF